MPSNRKKPHGSIPTVQNYDRKKKTKPVEKDLEEAANGSGEQSAKSDQKPNSAEKRPGDRAEEEQNAGLRNWTTPDPKGGNL